ncbi:MAG TPA: hypothetical protein QF353_00030 [Gammaproteobacteria bacterium]|nr:hypothetical protein [Gammaproteobacteria bacterium]
MILERGAVFGCQIKEPMKPAPPPRDLSLSSESITPYLMEEVDRHKVVKIYLQAGKNEKVKCTLSYL